LLTLPDQPLCPIGSEGPHPVHLCSLHLSKSKCRPIDRQPTILAGCYTRVKPKPAPNPKNRTELHAGPTIYRSARGSQALLRPKSNCPNARARADRPSPAG